MLTAKKSVQWRKALNMLSELEEMLARCDDKEFLQLAWAVNMLQSSFGTKVYLYLSYPLDAETSAMDSPFAVHKWELETLLTVLFLTPKEQVFPSQPVIRYRLDQFSTMSVATNLLRAFENHEAGSYLDEDNILLEMSRIAHRQFGWQRGFATTERLYRYAYIYAQGLCANYFENKFGISIDEFLKVGFHLYAQLHRIPWGRATAIQELGIDVELIERVLPLLSRDFEGIRNEAFALVHEHEGSSMRRIPYLPSALRRFPVIRDNKNNSYIAPLPQLIMARMTVGLYYDIADQKRLVTEANERFEEYVRKLISAYFPRFSVLRSQGYGTKRFPKRSPDVLISDADSIVVVVECKATKLTYEAQFADDPMQVAKGAFDQIVKGIVQLWRFFSDARREVYTSHKVEVDAYGILLTMDSWMQMSGELRQQAVDAARIRVRDEPEVIAQDMRSIIFCSMQDLADVMIVSNEDQFLASLEAATTDKYLRWDFRQVRRKAGGPEQGRGFPFDVAELLPWWNDLRGREQ